MTAVEQMPSVTAIAEMGLAEELTVSQRVDQFIERGPITRGIYDGRPLADAEDGVYVSPGVLTSQEMPKLVEVTMLPGAQLGAGDSHHGVLFGQVAVSIGGEAKVVEAAIKEFTAESDKAPYEHAMLLAARSLGFETFEPLALAKDGESTYLVTRRREEVESLDNVDWTIRPGDTERYESIVVPVLAGVADTLAKMHAAGLFHGDAQAKNFIRTDTNQPGVIDLEDAILATDPEDLVMRFNGGMDASEGAAYADLTHFWYAMIHPMRPDQSNVFLAEEPAEVCVAEFERLFLTPYMTSLKKYAAPEIHDRFNVDDVRAAAVSYIARTT